MGNIACVVIVKNAEAVIAEWLSYHLALGFETILLFDNDSTDSTLHVVKKFQRKHDIRVIPWPIKTKIYQTEAYEYGLFKFLREFTWLAFIDSDEFLTFPPGKTLKTLLDVPEGIAAIALPWAFFGSNPQSGPHGGPVRITPRPSSPRPLPNLQRAIRCRIFAPAQPDIRPLH